MAIKTKAENAHFMHHPEQMELANRLDEAFDITHGDNLGQLSFWLADPKPNVNERFGISQEVLVIYSQHATTDARVLTAIENISRRPDFKHRIEKVLVLLIHHGDKNETSNLLETQRDWVIVPIHADELINPARGSLFVRTRITQITGSIDLFGMSSPIKSEKYFFGRNELVQILVNRSLVGNENSGLFGLRKTGKTSVLYSVIRRLAESPVLAEYLDCQNPGVHAARWWQVLENIINRLCDTARTAHKKTCTIKGDYSQTDAGVKFSSDIKSIINDGNLDHIILLLDEVEFITPNLSGELGQHWDKDFLPFWQTLRATHQETMGRFKFIVAGVNPSSVEKSHFGETQNPIFQLAVPQYLEPLSKPSIRDMVRTIGRYAGLTFSEDVYGYLKETYGGHPYLIRIACSEVWNASNKSDPDKLTTIKIKNFVDRGEKIKARLAQPIKDILLSLVWWYPEQYDLLRILASGDSEFVKEYLNEQQIYMVQFTRYGLLKETGDFAIAELKGFLNEYGEAYKSELSPFTRGDMPLELLPEVPDLEALGKLFNKKCDLEISLRMAIMMYLGIRYNWDNQKISEKLAKSLHARSDRKNPEALFVGNLPKNVLNELYTIDLMDIIVANWDVFNPLFDANQTRFVMNMETINKARRVEAHTKPITPAEIEEFLNSYTWLLNRLSKVAN